MIISANSTSSPTLQAGLVTGEIAENPGYYQPAYRSRPGTTQFLSQLNQVVGLVPLFLCTGDDCRYGRDQADSISDPRQFLLPVFAQTSGTDPYFNDSNSFLFNFPSSGLGGSTFTINLQKLIGNTWTTEALLLNDSGTKNSTYGTPYPLNSLCANNNWIGYEVSWQGVLNNLGEGQYRIQVLVNNFNITNYATCWVTPPFCLKTFDCNLADRTVKWEAMMSGGIIGNISKTNCGGLSWSFCCQSVVNTPGSAVPVTTYTATPITWYDSIRVGGKFGDEDTTTERKSIKYATGIVKKIRDEAILTFTWQSSALPWWFHERFKVYGLFADQLQVSDYNIYQTDYNLKRYCVQADSGYKPDPNKNSQYQMVKTTFKPGTQYLIRTRCCDPVTPANNNPNSGGTTVSTTSLTNPYVFVPNYVFPILGH